RPTQLAVLLKEAVDAVQPALTRHKNKVSIALAIKHSLPEMMLDPDQIRQAMIELLHNAVQSSPRRSVHVTAQLERGGQGVMVQVIDDGEGMDAHTLSHAMDPFF